MSSLPPALSYGRRRIRPAVVRGHGGGWWCRRRKPFGSFRGYAVDEVTQRIVVRVPTYLSSAPSHTARSIRVQMFLAAFMQC
jgi:hypothetical protein